MKNTLSAKKQSSDRKAALIQSKSAKVSSSKNASGNTSPWEFKTPLSKGTLERLREQLATDQESEYVMIRREFAEEVQELFLNMMVNCSGLNPDLYPTKEEFVREHLRQIIGTRDGDLGGEEDAQGYCTLAAALGQKAGELDVASLWEEFRKRAKARKARALRLVWMPSYLAEQHRKQILDLIGNTYPARALDDCPSTAEYFRGVLRATENPAYREEAAAEMIKYGVIADALGIDDKLSDEEIRELSNAVAA